MFNHFLRHNTLKFFLNCTSFYFKLPLVVHYFIQIEKLNLQWSTELFVVLFLLIHLLPKTPSSCSVGNYSLINFSFVVYTKIFSELISFLNYYEITNCLISVLFNSYSQELRIVLTRLNWHLTENFIHLCFLQSAPSDRSRPIFKWELFASLSSPELTDTQHILLLNKYGN